MLETGDLIVQAVTPDDADFWLELRSALWPNGSVEEHRWEIEQFFRGAAPEPLEVLLARDGDGNVVGLAELSIRPYAEGCHSQRVAYLEGWYVVPKARGRGVGRRLIEAAEEWGRAQGCSELASDAEIDNQISRLAHRAVGFEETGIIRCFRKSL